MLRLQSNSTTVRLIRWGAVILLASSVVVAAHAVEVSGKPAPRPAQEMPEELQGVGIDEKLGTKLDLSLPVINEKGESVPLSSYFDGKHPVILSLVYYSCPGLCNYHLNGLTDGLKELDWSVGDKFKILALSFDPKETFETAAQKKASYLKVYNRPGTEAGWNFLTATPETIKTITDAVGFKYKWVEDQKEWSHGSAAIVLTPKGEVSRYLPGVMFEKKNLRLALNEATDGKIGDVVDHFVMYCFKYDPSQSQYVLAAFNVMKAGGGVMVLLMGLWLVPFWLRTRKKNSANRLPRS